MLPGLADTRPHDLLNGRLHYWPGFIEPERADQLFTLLLARTDWHQPQLHIYNRRVQTPRLVAFDGDAGIRYGYSGQVHQCGGWQAELEQLRDELTQRIGQYFNFALLNCYRDGRDAIGWHRDNEAELGPDPLIASVSLGAERDFLLRDSARGPSRSLRLEHGSLLLMSGSVHHHLPRRAGVRQPRINISFRQVVAGPLN